MDFLAKMKAQAEAKAKVYAQIGLDAYNNHPSVKAGMIKDGATDQEVAEYVSRLKKQAK